MNEQFVPVALKAAHVNNPPRGAEGGLYAEIGRSKPAPQGICVANSAGKVLVWALSFDDDESIVEFLDYAVQRYREFPDATRPVVAERFMRYPSHRLADIADTTGTLTIPVAHTAEERCPATPVVDRSALVGQVIGRVLDEDGRPLGDTRRQEHYLEARFQIPADAQRQFVVALREARHERFELPAAFMHAIVEPAYLGQLDVNPLGVHPDSQNDRRQWEFQAQRMSGDDAAVMRVQVTGESEVAGRQRRGVWDHAVALEWQGYIEVVGDEIRKVTLLAEGHERLRWGRFGRNQEPESRHLMAGHPIDLDCRVRYGLTAPLRP